MMKSISAIIIGGALIIGGWFLGHTHVPMPAAVSPSPSATFPDSGSIPVADTNTNASGVPVQNTSPATSPLSTASPTPQTSTESTATPASVVTTYPTGSPWLTTLPLGDNMYVTTAPKKGYIYLCHVQNDGQGAQELGSWIHGSTWTPSGKTAVEGSVSWPNASYSMTIANNIRLIVSNDLPNDRTTGIFPIQPSDPAYQIDRNPNTITPQNLSFSLPLSPTPTPSPNCIYGQVGIMKNGVELFDGFDAENRDAVAHEEQDSNEGHPDEDGTYHYHGFEAGIKNTSVSTVVGFAFDGFPITGGKLPSGNYLTTSDLDECHGMTSTITLDGKSVSSYHYVLTQDFPYSVGCFKGASVFKPSGPSGGSSTMGGGQMSQGGGSAPTGSGTPPTPPQAAIDACTGKTTGQSCTVGSNVTGTCTTIGSSFACKPN